ncbi:cancer-related nucleoside-triphosphatase homolog [Physella acuta]|uniref:cancer-related nucleoside-triphosphatase homolog n=1 Tax=Physella acuta TaxID=109671 RepID=UPI0027DDC55C|nr:cancer-related nucleoside-triphosphatase homolog [Physella acuta]
MATKNGKIKQFLITGSPGIGKTSLIKKIVEALKTKQIRCSGFFTEEIRSGGLRIGFDVVTLDNQRSALARINNDADNTTVRTREYKVGQYTVNLTSFEQTALITLQPPAKDQHSTFLYIVDEVGKMELFSQRFVQAVQKLMSVPNAIMIATIPVARGKTIALVEELKKKPNSQLFEVTHQNRDGILTEVMTAIEVSLSSLNN